MKTKSESAQRGAAFIAARDARNLTLRRLERAVRVIRQRVFNLPEHKQPLATQAIGILRARIVALEGPRPLSQYHWCYAAE